MSDSEKAVRIVKDAPFLLRLLLGSERQEFPGDKTLPGEGFCSSSLLSLEGKGATAGQRDEAAGAGQGPARCIRRPS
jgi:hypothetical protein